MQIETVSIGPEKWRNRSLRGMKMSENLNQKSYNHIGYHKQIDPLPYMKEFLHRLTNDEILKYFSEVRAVVVKLRQALSSVNIEIITMTRYLERLNKELDFIRKDIIVNKESQKMRKNRPRTEKDRDGADDLLYAENKHLWHSKKVFEVQLRNVQDMLQILGKCRQLLQANLNERARVLELTNESAKLLKLKLKKVRPSTAGPKLGNGQCTTVCRPIAYTSDADVVLHEALNFSIEANKVRDEVDYTISKVKQLNQAAHDAVNRGLMKKLAESTHLMQHLSLSQGENRKALQYSQTMYDKTDWSRHQLLRTEHLFSRERFDRPMVTVFQKHAGKYLPGTCEVIEANRILLKSIEKTCENLDMLHLAKLNLEQDVRSKTTAVKIDGDVFRLRRNRASHKWPIGPNF